MWSLNDLQIFFHFYFPIRRRILSFIAVSLNLEATFRQLSQHQLPKTLKCLGALKHTRSLSVEFIFVKAVKCCSSSPCRIKTSNLSKHQFPKCDRSLRFCPEGRRAALDQNKVRLNVPMKWPRTSMTRRRGKCLGAWWNPGPAAAVRLKPHPSALLNHSPPACWLSLAATGALLKICLALAFTVMTRSAFGGRLWSKATTLNLPLPTAVKQSWHLHLRGSSVLFVSHYRDREKVFIYVKC